LDSDKTVEDIDQMGEQIKKLRDIAALKPMEAIVQKWSKKVECFSDESLRKTVAVMLDNQHRYDKRVDGNDSLSIRKENTSDEEVQLYEAQIAFLKSQLDTDNIKKKGLIAESIRKLEKELNEITIREHEQKPENRFFLRGVNKIDEVVKFYDHLKCKEFVGIQPMTGPVGLAYSLRFHRSRTEQTLGADIDINDDSCSIGLTVENIEIIARTQGVSMPSGKLNGYELAKFMDRVVLTNIVGMIENEWKKEVPTVDEIEKSMLFEIMDGTRTGAANRIILGESLYERMGDKLKKWPELEPVFVEGVLPEDQFILAYKGKKDIDSGVILCPYIAFMVKTGCQEGTFQTSEKVMTRFAISNKLVGTEHYYNMYKYVDELVPTN